MSVEPKRGRRIRDLDRMKAKAKRLYKYHPKAVNYANHLAVCSCWMCGNPRLLWGTPTVQERRAFQADALRASDDRAAK